MSRRVLRALWPWLLVGALGGAGAYGFARWLRWTSHGEPIVWRSPHAGWLAVAAAVVGVLGFHFQRRRRGAVAFSRVALIGRRGVRTWLADAPAVLRVLAIAALAVALARPETTRVVVHQADTIDIMLVVDMSKSMEEVDMARDRLDAAQRVIRRFLRHSHDDRIGLVIFGQGAMLACPLTQDTKVLDQIVSDLAIGDVPELGTAIGDGLALALAQLRRSDAKSKVVILLSDGDSNWVTRFEPDEAAHTAAQLGVTVYTLLVGKEDDLLGESSANPATLRSIAEVTHGQFFRADDYAAFDKGFTTVRDKLDTTERRHSERVPDRPLFLPVALIAAVLLALELVLAAGWLRRLP